LAMDKIMTKKVWLHQGLPTPQYAVLRPDTDLAAVAAVLDLPLIIKPPHEGSTLGVTKVGAGDELREAYRLAARYDADGLAEQFIAGRELTVMILGGGESARQLRVIEIVRPDGNCDYEH